MERGAGKSPQSVLEEWWGRGKQEGKKPEVFYFIFLKVYWLKTGMKKDCSS